MLKCPYNSLQCLKMLYYAFIRVAVCPCVFPVPVWVVALSVFAGVSDVAPCSWLFQGLEALKRRLFAFVVAVIKTT